MAGNLAMVKNETFLVEVSDVNLHIRVYLYSATRPWHTRLLLSKWYEH